MVCCKFMLLQMVSCIGACLLFVVMLWTHVMLMVRLDNANYKLGSGSWLYMVCVLLRCCLCLDLLLDEYMSCYKMNEEAADLDVAGLG